MLCGAFIFWNESLLLSLLCIDYLLEGMYETRTCIMYHIFRVTQLFLLYIKQHLICVYDIKLLAIWKGFNGKLFTILHGTLEITHSWVINVGLDEVEINCCPREQKSKQGVLSFIFQLSRKSMAHYILIFIANCQG